MLRITARQMVAAARAPACLASRTYHAPKHTPVNKRISDRMEAALVKQANQELQNSNVYLAMSLYFDRLLPPLEGFRNYFKKESDEEREHGLKMFDYIHKVGGDSGISAFNSAPLNQWESAVHVMEDVVRLEVETTKSIHELVDLALQEKDHATFAFLQDFVKLQVDEVDKADNLLAEVRDYSSMHGLIYHLDKFMHDR